jgi:predicted nucleotidyltransferase component of viral defense system
LSAPQPDPALVEDIAVELGVDPSFIEKDWHAIRLIALLADIAHEGMRPVFSGGTSLSKGYRLIQRFSEDLDFKMILPEGGTSRPQRSAYRKLVVESIRGGGEWELLQGDILVGNASRFFSCLIQYDNRFSLSHSLRPQIKLEMTFMEPALPPEERSLCSFVAEATQTDPEVPSMMCVSPVETAADKLSALTWRVLTRDRQSEKDDPAIIRHLHDLATLEKTISGSSDFYQLAITLLDTDFKSRSAAAGLPPATVAEHVARTLDILMTDKIYVSEYEWFVSGMSYAAEDNTPSFEDALASLKRLISRV